MPTFRTTLQLHGKNATGIEIPPEVIQELGSGKKPAVTVTLDGSYTYRNTVATMGGVHLVGVSAEHRAASGVAAGDEVEVTLELDTAPRVVEVPADLAEALDAAGLRQAFDALAFSHRKEHVRAIESAKAPETRARRILKAIEKLRAG